jgi:hypothetical protein
MDGVLWSLSECHCCTVEARWRAGFVASQRARVGLVKYVHVFLLAKTRCSHKAVEDRSQDRYVPDRVDGSVKSTSSVLYLPFHPRTFWGMRQTLSLIVSMLKPPDWFSELHKRHLHYHASYAYTLYLECHGFLFSMSC